MRARTIVHLSTGITLESDVASIEHEDITGGEDALRDAIRHPDNIVLTLTVNGNSVVLNGNHIVWAKVVILDGTTQNVESSR